MTIWRVFDHRLSRSYLEFNPLSPKLFFSLNCQHPLFDKIMGRSGIVENTKMPFDSLGQPLGSCLAAFIVLILLALIFLAVSLLFSDSADTNQNQNQHQSRLFCDNSLNIVSKDFHKINAVTNQLEAGFAVPASIETANSANPIFKGTLTPIRKFEYAVGFT